MPEALHERSTRRLDHTRQARVGSARPRPDVTWRSRRTSWSSGSVSMIALDNVAGLPTVVLHATGRSIDAADVVNLDLRGKAVLIHTGWSRHWRTDTYFNNQHPFVSRQGAEKLAESGVRVVGIDSYNIDDTSDLTRPAHTILLRAGIFIVEHLTNLESLPESMPIRFFAVPPKVRGLGTFPVRAFAMV